MQKNDTLTVTVIKAYVSHYPNPIQFNKGDSLRLGELDDDYRGWIWVVTNDGNEGWAPVNVIDFSPGDVKGTATCAYDARELTTTLDERLRVMQFLNGWCRAVNSAGVTGWVPAETVQHAK